MADVPVHADTPMKFRGGGFTPVSRAWVSCASFAGVLVVWQLASQADLIDSLFLPSPVRIGDALRDLLVSGDLLRHLGASLQRIGGGWFIGALAGLCAGALIGLSWVGRSAGLPFISALFPIPKIALLPLLILWFGIGEASKVATIALGVFFPTVISAYSACDSVPRNLIRMAQSFGLPATDIVAKIILPGSMPGILAGFRISASVA